MKYQVCFAEEKKALLSKGNKYRGFVFINHLYVIKKIMRLFWNVTDICLNTRHSNTSIEFGNVLSSKINILIKSLGDLYLPNEILSDVASLFNQNETQEMTTRRTQGPYTWMTKFPMWRCRWKLTIKVECSPVKKKRLCYFIILMIA